SHLVVAPFPGAPPAAVYAEAASDGRPFFVVPWNGLYLIGTTDVRYDGDPGDVAIDDRELDYLVRETERLFPDSGGIRERVLYTMAGVRALPFAPGRAEGAITRRHIVHAHRDARGLYSIVGGKLTTYRALARDVLERLSRDGVVPRDRLLAGTGAERLPGAIAGTERDMLRAELVHVFDERTADRMLRTYGRLSARLLAEATERTELALPASPGAELRRVELVHAFETEWAETLVDLLQRRTMLGLGADFGFAEMRAAAAALVELGIWDGTRAEEEIASYRRFASLRRASSALPLDGSAQSQRRSSGAHAPDQARRRQ
ncbi:MAG TPA: glycerol-3-phosphate dehydrogenase C-terminal domain-containing protein, partial [Sandaracinaceae bacterium]